MDSPFLFSDSNLLKLLSSYKQWVENKDNDTIDGPKWIIRQQAEVDKMWDTDKLKTLSEDQYYNQIREYLESLGGAFPNHGKRYVRDTRNQVISNIEYIKNYSGDPFVLAEEILIGARKIRQYGRSFWTPIFQRKFPKDLPSWNTKTDMFLSVLGVYIDGKEIEKYKIVAQAFTYLNSLDNTLDFPKLDHLMHYGFATQEGQNLVKELTEIHPILTKFLKQANTNDQQTRSYPKKFKDFFLSAGFGIGTHANIPWLQFDIYERADSKGIFINYLFFKDINKLALVFGIKEDHEPKVSWPEQIRENYKTVGEEIPTPSRYKDSYVYKVYNVEEGKIQEENDVIEKDLNKVLEIYKEALEVNEVQEDEVRYWLIAAGPDGSMWESFIQKNMIAINYSSYNLGDLNNYNSKEALEEVMQGDENEDKKNDILAVWEFSKIMKPGDIVIAKKGGQTLLGYGKIESDYIYKPENKEYTHIRNVTWEKLNTVDYTGDMEHLSYKTLTDITKYPGIPESFIKAINEDRKNYWWLNSNPKIWDLARTEVGTRQRYTAKNENGNKRRIYKNFEDARVGDLMIGYISTPIKQISSICKITKTLEELDGKEIEFEVIEQIENPVSWKEVTSLKELQNAEPFINPTGSLFKLTEEEFELIRNIIEEKNPTVTTDFPAYTKELALKDLFIQEQDFDNIIKALKYKKNIILQGPPGVGKTFYAKRFAYYLIGKKDPRKVKTTQFHQSYSYEDFIQGYKPTEEGTFTLKNGIFYEFCIKAQRDPDNPYIFIIDEINRGNLSKIFGELMMLIESDKRGEENRVNLTYQNESDLYFYIPENLYLIGTMNTADRSLAMVDYALRRRFRFITLKPEFNTNFSKYLANMGVSDEIIQKIITKIPQLNEIISSDSTLGEGFTIGHSFFTPIERIENSKEWYKTIIDNEIAPLLHEYYFDDSNKANELITDLY
jgi:5-methylcytosine-specific restriction protein B